MSEEILKLFLNDLKTIRLVCQKCATVTEMNLRPSQPGGDDGVGTKMQANKCPVCDHPFRYVNPKMQGYEPFVELEKLFAYLDGAKGVKVEFPIKLDEKT